MLSIILSTSSKPCFLPWMAINTKSTLTPPRPRRAAIARFRTSCELSCTCSKLGLGRDFLNSSKASSLFRSLMVSAIASSSSARVFLISSYSAACDLQVFSNSSKYPSSSSTALVVAFKSLLSVAILTANSPVRPVFTSIASVAAAISSFFALVKLLKFSTASVSALVISSRRSVISSTIVFRMPTISSEAAPFSPVPDCKKASRSCLLSSEAVSTMCLKTAPASDCRKDDDVPFSMAAIAADIAFKFAFRSASSDSKAVLSFLRMLVACSTASLAVERSSLCCLSSSSTCFFSAVSVSIAVSRSLIFCLPSATEAVSFSVLVLQ
mmetsp:Transcript_81443/g.217855  ORF Transcript_81443/g.217855 Transcript_81443/m.217855 type:complete len:325 (+) Transcript_81443:1215-2189(+)